MKALLVGGPLHGKMIPVESETLVKVFSKDTDGEVYEYIRHTDYPMAGKGWVLFVLGKPDYDEVIDAIQKSELSDTGKLRALGGDYTYIKISGD